MRFLLGGLVLIFNLLDNATTFVCLTAPATGFEIFEANPVARWLFEVAGLTEGLVIETLITTAAVVFLVMTTRIAAAPKLLLLFVLTVLPAWAVANNLQVIQEVGSELAL